MEQKHSLSDTIKQCENLTKASASVLEYLDSSLECRSRDSTNTLKLPNALKSINIAKMSLDSDCQEFLSGTISQLTNPLDTTAIASLSGQDFHVSPSLEQVVKKEIKINDISGLISSNSFARLDLAYGWVKMLTGYEQLTLDGFSEPYSKSFPKAGIVWSGVAYQRQRWVQSTNENASGLLPIDQKLSLPTPTASDAAMGQVLNENTQIYYTENGTPRKISNQGVDGSVGLTRFVQLMLPTPTASNSNGSNSRPNRTSGITSLPQKPGQTLHLSAAVQNLPASTARDWKGEGRTHSLPTQTQAFGTRMLNPFFVAAMMGFPPTWIDTSCDTQNLNSGSPQPQSPPSLGSLVQKLQAFRQKIEQNTSNSTKSTSESSENTRTGLKPSEMPSAPIKPPSAGKELEKSFICGVDESKRGCYFGPLFACAYVLDESQRDRVQKALAPNGKIRDSKQLSPQQRQELIALLQEYGTWRLGYAKASEIDKMGVNVANDLAFTRAIAKLPTRPTKVLVDGNRRLKELPSDIEQVCLPKGDSKELAIAAASILVKEYSDRVIEYLSRNLPHNFKKHHGYSMDADLHEFGVDHPQFRKSFNSVKKLIYDKYRLQHGSSRQSTSASATSNLSGILTETSRRRDNAGISKLNLPSHAQNSGCHSSTQASSTDGVGISVVPQQWEKLVVPRPETEDSEQRSKIMIASLKTAISSPDSRHTLDFYETPAWMVIEAFKHLDISGVVGECCVGAGAIASLLKLFSSIEKVWTNDIDPNKPADYRCDATDAQSWSSFPESNWIITNPPYSDLAAPIVLNAYRKAKRGVVMFLRQSWLEGCDDRAEFLQQNPPTHLISLPRYCFRRGNKGTWTSDSSPVWAICWDKQAQGQQLITRTKEQISLYHRTPDTAPTMQEIQDAIASISSNNLVKLDSFLQHKILSDVSIPVEYVAIAQIRRDGGTQTRSSLDLVHVQKLVEVLEDNGELDPVVLFYDEFDYWLADGFHRTKASEDFGLTEINARVLQGTRRDAVLYSVGANAEHKSVKPRSREDKKRAVLTMLQDDEWSAWSDNEIARRCKVSQPFVSGIRQNRTNNIISSSANPELTNNVISQSKRTYTKNGKQITMDVGAIGRKKKDSVEKICDAQVERGEYVNPWKIGDVCQIVKRGDGTLSQYDGVWGIVSETKTRQCVVQIWNKELLVKAENLEELNVGEEFKTVCDRVRSLMKRHMSKEITLKRGQLAFLQSLGSQAGTFELEDLELLACIEARSNNHDASLVQATQFIVENIEYQTDDEARMVFDAIAQAHELTTNS